MSGNNQTKSRPQSSGQSGGGGSRATETMAIDSTSGGQSSYLVTNTTVNEDKAGFTKVVVRGCCDESEAIRTALHRFGIKETHHVKCRVDIVDAK